MVRRSSGLVTVLLLTACQRVPTPGLARGEALFNTCAACHGPRGGGNQALGAPAIAGLPAWYVQSQLEMFQHNHRGYMPFDTNGIRMKSMAWTLDAATDPASVAAYVASLAPTMPAPVLQGGHAAVGQVTFQAVCQNCHGPDAKGMEAMHSPPLAQQSDWYLLHQLKNFHGGLRGTDTANVWAMTMRPNAMMLDDTAMVNVLAYIQTLRQAAAK
jgi:cytochrome c oxidase subunit 2